MVVLFLWLIMASASSIYGAPASPAGSSVVKPSSNVPAKKPNSLPASKETSSTQSVSKTDDDADAVEAPEPEKSDFQKAADGATPSVDEIKGLVADKIVDDKAAARKELLAKSNMSIIDKLKEQIAKIKESFKKMMNIGSQISGAYKQASYLTDSSIKVSEPNSGALIINLGYPGSGDITTGFMGAQSRLDIPLVPNFLINPVMKGFAKFSQSVGINRFIIITPSDECLSKIVLLACSKLSKKVSESEFIKEFHFLLARLYKTPSVGGLKSLSKDIPSAFTELFQELEVAGQPLSNLFLWYGPEFEKMLNNDFAKAPVFAAGDSSAVINSIITILLRSSIDYHVQKAAYLKSPEGKTAGEQLDKNLLAFGANDKTSAYATFNLLIPGFAKIKQDVLSRLAPFVKTPFFIKLKEKMAVIIHSFIEELGITQSDIEGFSGSVNALTLSNSLAENLVDKTPEDIVFAHEAVADDSEESESEDDASQDDSEATGVEAEEDGDATPEELAADDEVPSDQEQVEEGDADATLEEAAADDAVESGVEEEEEEDGDATPEELAADDEVASDPEQEEEGDATSEEAAADDAVEPEVEEAAAKEEEGDADATPEEAAADDAVEPEVEEEAAAKKEEEEEAPADDEVASDPEQEEEGDATSEEAAADDPVEPEVEEKAAAKEEEEEEEAAADDAVEPEVEEEAAAKKEEEEEASADDEVASDQEQVEEGDADATSEEAAADDPVEPEAEAEEELLEDDAS